jgi:intein-encoded DNA endonuclease-like protein
LRNQNRFLPFEEAREIVRGLGIGSFKEYVGLARQGNIPNNIPVSPDGFYKNRGWKNWFDFLGTNRIDKNRKHTVNHNFFKKWFHDMAYILGLWFSDGCIVQYGDRNSKRFIITLKDKYLLEEISKKMGYSGTLYKNSTNDCYNLSIHSSILVDDIIKLGGKYRKSKNVKFPKVPKKYLPDFVRGFWDGDGGVSYNGSKRHKCYVSYVSSGSKSFIYDLHELLKKNIRGLSGRIGVVEKDRMTVRGITYVFKKPVIVYHISFGANDTRRIRDYMYNTGSDLKMIRKWEKFVAAGKINISCEFKKFVPFSIARRFVRKLGLNSWDEWRAYCKSGKRPENIPTDPSRTYEKEYRGAKDWIGNAFWSLNKIKKFINPLNIKGSAGWRNYCTSGKKPKEIPSSIGRVYKDEWPGFKIFLRKNSEKMYNSE